MDVPPIIIARPPRHVTIALLVTAGTAIILSIAVLLWRFGPVMTAWGNVVEPHELVRYGIDPVPGRQAAIVPLPAHLAETAGSPTGRADIAVEVPTDDGGVRRVPGTLIKVLTAAPRERAIDAPDGRQRLVLIAFAAPTALSTDTRVTVRLRIATKAPRAPGWLSLL
ncbi:MULTISPECIES: hypothetical protein [Burkholderia]|uniref:Uncharacterized protein n=1 Tax=Burkholderia pyrrocinia TaxID=60550 RepID=A0A318HZJ1_BURPY|nr:MULTISPECIES: hypothetical protein [Burkholderia]PXX23839.1 hypothetical protein NA66_103355 [Burkholderia pyrrocinia]SFW87807.1 hypothetical protein SAMN03159384_06505 [Burkholderia sp. NFACC33-1]SFY46056.1 hypothetical protein SAMN03159408_06591 [Burkholderia sp. NFPP32]